MFKLNSSNFKKRESGAVFAEAALCLSLFLLIVFAFIDFTRMMAVESQLTVAAEQALTVASTDSGIDYYDFNKAAQNQQQPQEFVDAQTRVIDRARAVASAGNGSAEKLMLDDNSLKIPRTAPYTGATMEQVLETVPIEINISTTYTPILPILPQITVKGRAIGYREPRKMANMPLIVDCNGNLLGTANYEKQPCPCPVDKMWDFVGKRCVCRNAPANAGDCGCAPGWELTADYTGCQCVAVDCAGTNPNRSQNMSTCACQCNLTGGVDAVNCKCLPQFVQSGLACNCPTGGTLPPNTQRSNIDCSIVCKSGFIPSSSGPVALVGCVCPTNRILSGGSCVCDSSTCPNTNQVRSGSTCATCACGAYASLQGGACQCDSVNRVMNPSTKNCVCLANNTCPLAGQIRTGSNCDCVCAAPLQDTGSGACTCIDPNMQRSGTTCVCKYAAGTSCGTNKAWTSGCLCSCTNGRVDDGMGGCVCPGAQVVLANGSCGCAGSPPAGGSFVGTSCSTTCNVGGQVIFNNACVRPECAVSRCIPFTLGDGSCSGCPEM